MPKKPNKRNIKTVATPKVKPASLKAKPTSPLHKILWGITLIMLFLIPICLSKDHSKDGKKNVKKEKSGTPAFTWASWFNARYQRKLEDYLHSGSNIGGRLTLIKNQIDYWIFNKINVKGCVIGKEGYIISEGFIKGYMGLDFIGEKKIEEKLRKAKVIQDTLKKKGIDLVLVFAPGSASYYPEYIPDVYFKYKKDSTNYDVFIRNSRKLNLNFIDLRSYFLSLKEKTKYPLFPQLGTHWSYYGECIAADTLIKYIEKIHNTTLPHITWQNVEYPSEPKVRDNDMIKKGKLIYEPKGISMAYPQVQFSRTANAKPIKVLGIGDSYYRGFLYLGVMSYVFDNGSYWYYYNKVVPESDTKLLEVWELDLKQEIEKNKVIIVLSNDGALEDFGCGFIEDAYLLYTDPKGYKAYSEKKNTISFYKKQIHENPDLLDAAVNQSEELKISLDSAIMIKVNEMIKRKQAS
jgi:hypothetical protein